MEERWACADDCTHPDHRHVGFPPRRTRRKKPSSHPPCVFCGEPVLRRGEEPRSKYKIRKTCSPMCTLAHQRVIQHEKALVRWAEVEAVHAPCPVCNAPVVHRKSETLERFVARATCGARTCVVELMSRNAGHGRPPKKRVAVALEETAEGVTLTPQQLAPDVGLDFSGQNLRFRRHFQKVSAPVRQTLGGVSANWLVRGGA